MIAVLTGDIINSRKASSPQAWQEILKQALAKLADADQWELFRGDSFQVALDKPELAFRAAVYLKACMRTLKGLDVRIAIGIGQAGYQADKVTESYGDAYVYSGEEFELLKKNRLNLAVRTGDLPFDEVFNLSFRLALTFMDHWTPHSAELMKTFLENEHLSQKELGVLLGIGQSSVSERYNRAYVEEVLALHHLFVKRIQEKNS